MSDFRDVIVLKKDLLVLMMTPLPTLEIYRIISRDIWATLNKPWDTNAYCSWPGGNWSLLAEPFATASGDITIGRSEVWDLWPGVAYVSSWAAWLSIFSASEVACKSVEAIVSSMLADVIGPSCPYASLSVGDWWEKWSGMPAAYEFDLDTSTTGNGLEELLCDAVAVYRS